MDEYKEIITTVVNSTPFNVTYKSKDQLLLVDASDTDIIINLPYYLPSEGLSPNISIEKTDDSPNFVKIYKGIIGKPFKWVTDPKTLTMTKVDDNG